MGVVTKPKRRNSEKRKEKSRDAARSRRSKEAEIFCQLAHVLPVPYNILIQLDKASIVRLGITHLKLRKLFQNAVLQTSLEASSAIQLKMDHVICRALDGFLMLVNKDGSLVYITENVNYHLGLTQMELLGHSVYEFLHPCDHDELQEVISERNVEKKNDCSLFLRMKCTLTSKGRSINIKSACYKVVHCSGSAMAAEHGTQPQHHQVEPLNLSKSEAGTLSFTILMCRPIVHSSDTDMLLDSKTFVSHHNLDMKFIFCDERITDLLGFESQELLGKSVYDFHHAMDAEILEKSYKTLFAKGQCITGLYRFLAKTGGYVWMETQSLVINNPRTDRAQFVVCVNCVVSEVECREQVFSAVQQHQQLLVQSQSVKDEKMKEGDALEAEEDEISDEEEEMEDEEEATFMTEKLLKFARKANYQSSDKHLPQMYSSLATELENADMYTQRAPYISTDDTVFEALASAIAEQEKYLTQSCRDCTTRRISEKPASGLTSNVLDADCGHTVDNLWSKDNRVILTPAACISKAGASFPVEKLGVFHLSATDVHPYFGSQKLNPLDMSSVFGGSSVLKNLLVNGEDVNYGYRLMEASAALKVPPPKASADDIFSVDAAFSSMLHRMLCSRNDSIKSS